MAEPWIQRFRVAFGDLYLEHHGIPRAFVKSYRNILTAFVAVTW